MLRHRFASACAVAALVLTVGGSVAHAQPNQNNTPQNPGQKGQNLNLTATPELDSIVLFLVGAAGMATPWILQRRRRRGLDQDRDEQA